MRFLGLLLLAGCSVAGPEPAMDGSWGISGAGPACGFYAEAEVAGSLDDFQGTAVMDSQTVAVVGSLTVVRLGTLALAVSGVEQGASAPYLSGTFQCNGAPGAWSMWRYP